jgi:hypothetical protein
MNGIRNRQRNLLEKFVREIKVSLGLGSWGSASTYNACLQCSAATAIGILENSCLIWS